VGGISRRGFLRLGAGAAVLGGGAALSGCGVLGAKAGTMLQKTKILLVLRAWGYGSTILTASEQTVDALLYEFTQPWRAQNPGVDIKILPNLGGPQEMIAELLSGDAPDIYHSWHPDAMFASPGFTTDLTAYIKDSHADLGVFNGAQMALFQQPGGILGLPAFLGILTLAVNLGMIDKLGLERPATGWTYTDYATLSRQVASGTGGQAIGGAYGLGNIGSPNGYLPPECILQGFGGSYVEPGDNSVCTLDSPQVVKAMNWVYPLAQEGAIDNPSAAGSLSKGTVGMQLAATWALIDYATTWQGLNWAFHELPSFPAVNAPVCSCTSDFYALNPRGKHLDLAWSLLHWMTFEPYWQQAMMKVFLLSPAQMSLWEEWVTRVEAYAPPLANRNLAAFAKLAQGGHAYPEPFMQYEADAAYGYMNTWGPQIWSGGVTIQEGLTQMTDQINALEQTAKKEAAATSKPAPKGEYAPPSSSGLGDPYTNGSPYIIVSSAGQVTMLGTGYDIFGSQDACVFYCKAQVHQTGSWICRVDNVSNISCPALSIWAKVGLMARADLSDDTPMVALHVTGANGIEWEARPLTGTTPSSQGGLEPPGLKSTLMTPVTTPVPNFLSQPVWLRLDRDKYTWTPYASLDGTTWSAMGTPQPVEMGASWIGVMATAHNQDFGDKGYIRAVFDKLNFAPTKMVQLGVVGVAPVGGPVPSNWATLTTPVAD
jgi:hypothetical protein